MSVIRYLSDLELKCKKNNIKLLFKNSAYLKADGSKVEGYFCENPAELAIAFLNPDSLEILVHESCHLDQYLNQAKIWNQSDKSYLLLSKWLNGQKISNISYHIEQSLNLELDCERRAIKKILKYKLPINLKNYIQKANSYLYLYTYLKVSKKWPKKLPYQNKELWKSMPSKFLNKYKIEHLTEKQLKLYYNLYD